MLHFDGVGLLKNTKFKLAGFILLMLLSISLSAQEPESDWKSLALRSFALVNRQDLPLLVHHLIPSLEKLNEETQAKILLLEAYNLLIGSPCPDSPTFMLKRGCAFFLSRCGEFAKARRLYLESYEDSKKKDLKDEYDLLFNVIFSLAKMGFYDDAFRLIEEMPEPFSRQLNKARFLADQQEAESKSLVKPAIFPALIEEIQNFSGTISEKITLLSTIKGRYHQSQIKLFGKPYSKFSVKSPRPVFFEIAENLLASRIFCLAVLYPSYDSLSIMTLARQAAFNKKIPQDLKKRLHGILFKRTLKIEDFKQHAYTLCELYHDRDAITETSAWKDAMINIFRHSDQLDYLGKIAVFSGFPNVLIEENRFQEAISLVKEIPDLAERNLAFLRLARNFASLQSPATGAILFEEAEKTGLVTPEDHLRQILSQLDSESFSEQTDANQVENLLVKAMEKWQLFLSQTDSSTFASLFESYAATLMEWKRARFLILLASAVSDSSLRGYALGAIAMEFHKQQMSVSSEIRADFERVLDYP